MTEHAEASAWRAAPADADMVARLLHDFNTEYDAASPGVQVLSERLAHLLAGDTTLAYLVGEPATGVALLTLHTNVWLSGRVALLDELYVQAPRRGHGLGTALIRRILDDAPALGIESIEIHVDAPDVDAQRFYERHGFRGLMPDTGERAYYYVQDL
ncbi:GNAT family N-acetyltransferase [Demequina zhanjiangensis]|uniref:GNAT family N-acetyltransferase n=1 Tax=Demequina zhanjiangensis TaxID=3051659 RepID=A0ABT8G092_9MICO|nr:GNAT family N-acetyltransferase [Demequina sp. SYSU T00b26]MDN4472560.1 GNAT family N-acetyltransferase [Demequina sp. SYSU T00b26]